MYNRPGPTFFSEIGSLRLVLVSFSSLARKTSSITLNNVLRSPRSVFLSPCARRIKSSTNISVLACGLVMQGRFGSLGMFDDAGPPCFTFMSFALSSNVWNGCSLGAILSLALVMSAIVSVAAQKWGGDSFQPIGRQSGNATSLCLPGMSGKINASFGISSMRRFTL